jgi:ATP-binding cassette subfamily B (MDR/TAP) protein 1
VQFFVIYMAAINGAESAGTLLSFGPSDLPPLHRELLLTQNPDIAQATAAANRILSFRVKVDTSSKKTLQLEDSDGGVKIELRDLWFKYPTRDMPIFTGLNLTVSTTYIH